MRLVRVHKMDDIGVGVPLLMPLPLADDLLRQVIQHASITRGEGLRHARREIAKDRGATLRVLICILKVLAIPRTEEVLAAVQQQAIKVECGPGCSACCNQNVEVSIPEAILVALQVIDPDDPRRKAILDTATAVAGLGQEERLRCGRPCPLLVDNKCSVYENRPLLCRATLSPCRQACYDALHSDVSVQIYPMPQFYALGDKDAMRGICKDLGLQHDNVDLVQTVAAILRDPTSVVRWAAGERAFAALPPKPFRR
jgi:hypothetical protein